MEPTQGKSIYSRTLSVGITTDCNLRCPECCTGMPKIHTPIHYGDDYLEHAASYLRGFDNVRITGGEPTMHPEFRRLVPHFKEMFACQTLTLLTNGYKIVEYADVLHHFDEILIAHYPNNQREVDFVRKHFRHSTPDGPTLHLCTARRAKNPQPCSIQHQFVKYMYGRLYPCRIPAGFEHIGIPLTDHWQEDIEDVPLPCAECFLAEEGESLHSETNSFSVLPASAKREHDERDWRWPDPPDDIVVYGLEVDSWIQREALIRLCSQQRTLRLRIVFESYAPKELYPITLIFQDEHGRHVHTHVVSAPGISEARITLKRFFNRPKYVGLKVLCDKMFIPHHLDSNNPDTRELGIRMAMLRYQ